MKITNPTNNEISVKIFGNNYTITANGILTGISREVALYWRGLHEFLLISEEETVSEKVAEEKKTPAPETITKPTSKPKTGKNAAAK